MTKILIIFTTLFLLFSSDISQTNVESKSGGMGMSIDTGQKFK